MNPPSKSTSLQAYRLILYSRALHPELFRVRGRRTIVHQGYEFEAWIMPGSHLMRFQYGKGCATELITDQEDGIPDRGILAAIPCAGERDHEQGTGGTADGVGGHLVQAVVERAATSGETVVPHCPFTRSWLERHPDEAGRISIDWPASA